MISPLATTTVADIELQLLLEAVYRFSGYDFRDYAPTLIKRRLSERVRAEGVRSLSGLQEKILREPEVLERLIYSLSTSPTELFRDPQFFSEFRTAVVPMLRTFPFVRLWVAGCATGEEVYSLAILLREEGLHERCRIYGTDVAGSAIGTAKSGRIPLDSLEAAGQRYREAGGRGKLEDHIALNGGTEGHLKSELREGVVFSTHNLACDGSFNEFHVILCRNVMQQYNKTLAYRAHHVVFESLARFGYLGLGSKETVRNAPHQRCYETVTEQIYRRIR